ncbi:MAG: AAA family ATPase [Pseudomonadota bacterium]
MLKSLKIKNFRSLEDFEVGKLGRVNLIVGKNNSGKSSVLEALRIFAGNAQLDLLETIADEHDEKYRIGESERGDADTAYPFEDFFSGRHYPLIDGQAIEIGDPLTTGVQLSIEHGFYVESIMPADGEEEPGIRIRRQRMSKADLSALSDEMPNQALFVRKGERESMLRMQPPALLNVRMPARESPGASPCSVIPTRFVSIDELANEWDKIALTDSQQVIHDAMRIISPEFEALAFVRKENSNGKENGRLSRSAKVKLRNHDRPVPLNSLGDGMLRVLQLVLKIFPAKGGFLLVDEFENGLHYAVQEKVWALVFELAERLDIQVFATTHSWDCIESFAKVANERQDVEGVLFRVGRSARTSDKGRVIATVFDEDQLFNITQSDVEVR